MRLLETIIFNYQDTTTYPDITVGHAEHQLDNDSWIEKLQNSCQMIGHSLAFFLPKSVKQAIFEVYESNRINFLSETKHAVAFPFSETEDAIPGSYLCMVGDSRTAESIWPKGLIRLYPRNYQLVFEAYTTSRQEKDDTAHCRLSCIPCEQPIVAVLRHDPDYAVPQMPIPEETTQATPHVRLEFGTEAKQAIAIPIAGYNEKLSVFNTEAASNHQYWQAHHHRQGLAWSPGTFTLKIPTGSSSWDTTELEIYTHSQVQLQADTVRALAIPLTVTSGTVPLAIRSQTIAILDIEPGSYTVLFESNTPVPILQEADSNVSESHTDAPEDEPANHDSDFAITSTLNVEDEEEFAHSASPAPRRCRLTFIPSANPEAQILHRDEALSAVEGLHLETTVREIAGPHGRTVKRAALQIKPTTTPIREPITKFGGQPVWLEEPQWPIARTNGKPMEFIGQVALDPQIFGDIPGKMAYIFMSSWADDEEQPIAWEPDYGDNAVIIQPNGLVYVPTQPLATGPSMKRWHDQLLSYIPSECKAELTLQNEAYYEESAMENMSSLESDEAWESLSINKIGGSPWFIQNPEYPFETPSPLILQLHDNEDLSANFGTGVAYVFLSPDGRSGKMLWQC
ncbi:MAG TPA: DUF1963 domain-containing protein [Stenomitos sp.]